MQRLEAVEERTRALAIDQVRLAVRFKLLILIGLPATVIALAAAITLAVMALNRPEPAWADIPVVKGLQIQDAAGQTRIAMTVLPGIAGLYVYDAAGRTRMALSASSGIPGLYIYDGAGRARVVVYTQADGTPSISLLGETEIPRLTLGATTLLVKATGGTEGRPISSLVFFDKDANVVSTLP